MFEVACERQACAILGAAMPTLEDLEAQILATWDRETIEVYGDQLQSLGEPRGELIAIDLAIEDSGSTPELVRRREELIDAWLGDTVPNGRVRCGFVDVDATGADPVAQIHHAFDGPGSRFIRSVAIVGAPNTIAATAQALAATVRPSMTALTIRQWDEADRPTLGAGAAQAMIEATPHLRELAIDGRQVLDDFPHPAVTRLRISGFDGIASLVDGTLAMPALVALDLALYAHLAKRAPGPSRDVFRRVGVQMPRLVDLDLRRNNPGYADPDSLGGDVDVAVAVQALGIADQLRVLRVPTSTTAREREGLRERFPAAELS